MLCFGSEWRLTPYRLAVHEPTRTAVIADPHLGYNDARRRSGDAIPLLSFEDQLAPLKRACAVFDLADLVVAGDLCEARLDEEIVARFDAFVKECGLFVRAIVPGNHDRGWAKFDGRLPMFPDGYALGSWTVIHGDRPMEAERTVMGHAHPAWRAGSRMQACYLAKADRLVLPAFSHDAAGGAVNRTPLWTGYRAIAIDGDQLIDRGLLTEQRRVGSLRGVGNRRRR